MKRRNFIQFGATIFASSLYATTETNKISFKEPFKETLAIPPLAKYTLQNGTKVFDLHVRAGKASFLNGAQTSTYGINGDFLGPTIRVENNDKVKINVKNSLNEITTMHWHGLKVKGSSDGGPHNVIQPNQSWSADLAISQRASMCWYHPHAMHKTGAQVFMGLAGLFIIDDDDSKKLPLPREYGVDDIPLVIQDRRFDNKGEFLYKQSMHDTMMGVTGNVQLINGIVDPFVEVEPKAIRFRILNGSNARIYNLMFQKQHEFFQIAGDSSFLPSPVSLKNFILAPGERAEIVVDFSKFAGQELYFGDALGQKPLLKINVKNNKPIPFTKPNFFVNINEYENFKIFNKRTFTLNMSMGWLGINEKQMKMDRIDEVVQKDKFEIWEITNQSRMLHPFHVHGTAFKIISRDGKKPLVNELGLKDTVLVYGNQTVQILAIFKHEADEKNPYMYHCHILEHEDAGMMGQFTVG